LFEFEYKAGIVDRQHVVIFCMRQPRVDTADSTSFPLTTPVSYLCCHQRYRRSAHRLEHAFKARYLIYKGTRHFRQQSRVFCLQSMSFNSTPLGQGRRLDHHTFLNKPHPANRPPSDYGSVLALSFTLIISNPDYLSPWLSAELLSAADHPPSSPHLPT
jgi:hypothetical protein